MTIPLTSIPEHDSFLNGGGNLGKMMASHNWSATSLGEIRYWPQSLKTALGIILRSSVPMILLWNEDGVMLYNDAFSEFAASRHPHTLGLPVRVGWPEVADFNDNVMKVGFGGGSLSYRDQEMTLLRGLIPEQVWMNLDYSPVVGESGAVAGVVAIVVETTAKVKTEKALRTNEEQFRTFAQAVPNQVWAADAGGQLYWFNDRVYEYSGASEGSLNGDAWAAIVSPDDVEDAARQWADALVVGETYETEFRIRRADGIYRWHLIRALPIRDENGKPTHWIGTNTDIEDQKSTARELEHLNATLEQQVAHRTADRDRMWRLSTDMMLVADFTSTIIAVNPALTALLGIQESDLVGFSFMDFVHPEDHEATVNQAGKLRNGEPISRFENRYRRQDGSYRLLSWTAVPDERFIHAVGRDITADREAAAAMRRTELALQQSQKMETIGKLTGGVAHDFNNLLQVISGNLQLLSFDVVGNAVAERRISNALAGVTRGAKLASYLLAFGRRQALDPKVVKIGRFIEDMEDMLRRSLGEEIDIKILVSGGLWNTFVDTAQIENAVLNLSINARDAMDGVGKLTIEVGNAVLDESYARRNAEVSPGQYVVVAVSDTGSGMTPEVKAQAFEPFFSTKPEGKGTGLGLSMVYGLIKQSGGHVSIYSEVGYGTTVKLYLLRSHDNEELDEELVVNPAVGGTETILVAEDDEQVRNTVVEILRGLGYHVLKTSDAASALRVVESGVHVDVLFIDVVMPGPLRSPELARKACERPPQLAVLFTSGYTENAIVHGGRLDPGVELLGKPYTKEALALKIRHVIANRQ